MKIISFFSGCGGLDLGFKKAGFETIWANDNAPSVWETFKKNFPDTQLNKKSIRKLRMDEIPNGAFGIIGGPPCQSWSNAGSGRGIYDKRGLLFFDYIKIIEEKQPYFFVAENVEGLLSIRNRNAFSLIRSYFENAGYNIEAKVLDASNYNVPQRRKRVFFVGYRYDLPMTFTFPQPYEYIPCLRDTISDIQETAIPSVFPNLSNGDKCIIYNHEYWQGSYSYIFKSRNRVLSWDRPSYTIQASGRQMSIHPQAPPMVNVGKDKMIFEPGKERLYRRLSIRECARIQSFPDDFKFYYKSLISGYKMIGNSVPVNLSFAIAYVIYNDMRAYLNQDKCVPSITSLQQMSVPA